MLHGFSRENEGYEHDRASDFADRRFFQDGFEPRLSRTAGGVRRLWDGSRNRRPAEELSATNVQQNEADSTRIVYGRQLSEMRPWAVRYWNPDKRGVSRPTQPDDSR